MTQSPATNSGAANNSSSGNGFSSNGFSGNGSVGNGSASQGSVGNGTVEQGYYGLSESLGETDRMRSGAPLQGGGLKPGALLEEPQLVYGNAAGAAKRKARWGMGLRQKVTMVAVALGILPALAIGGFTYSIASNALLEKAKATVELGATSIEEKLVLFMRERYGDIQVIAQIEELTEEQMRSGLTPAAKQKSLDRFIKAYPVYDSIVAFDLKGNVMAQSSGEALESPSERTYFQDALKAGQAVIANPVESRSSEKQYLYFASPIKDQVSQKVVGVVRTRVPLKVIDKLLSQFTATFSGEVKDQRTEYHLYGADEQLFLDSDSSSAGATSNFAHEEFERTVDVLEKEGKEITLLTSDAILTYLPFRSVKDNLNSDFPPLDWKILMAVDQKTALATQRQLLLSLAGGSALAALALAGIAAWLANRSVRPLLEAVATVKAIGEGKLDRRLKVRGSDEMADLAMNLNEMAEQLEDFNAEQVHLTRQVGWLTQVATGAQEIQSRQELEARFQQILWEALDLLQVDRLVIYRLKPDGTGYISHEAVVQGWPMAMDMQITDACIPQATLEAYAHGRVVPTNDVFNAGFHSAHVGLMERLQIKANLVVPILDDGQVFGLLVAHYCDEPHAWQPSEISFMKQLAGQISIMLLLQQVESARGKAEEFAEDQRSQKESLQRRVLELLMEVDPVSRGDLTIRAKVTEDEIGTVADSYNATIESLRRIVSQVKDAALRVANNAGDSEVAMDELSLGATQQTEEITTALLRIGEMAESIREVSKNAMRAEAAVQQAAQTVEAGDAAMNLTVEGIFGIRETVGEAAKKVKRLGESSQKISKVVNLIGSFAEQTNLLALNASIEAAHAGEEGRGFAVVADEVRSLARQSAAATAEIEALVAEIQAETNQVSAAMEQGTEQVVAGTQLVENARQNLAQISSVSAQLNDLVTAIARAAVQQSQASDSVSLVMTDVARIATKTSSSATTVSVSVQELVTVAKALQDSVGKFKVS
jgi:methyl-accepting chemotaxis protein PixJ